MLRLKSNAEELRATTCPYNAQTAEVEPREPYVAIWET